MENDRNVLKAQALLNKNTELANENADLRVELHLAGEQIKALNEELANRPPVKDEDEVPEQEPTKD